MTDKLSKFSQTKIPLVHGEFEMAVYKDPSSNTEPLVVSKGIDPKKPVFVRIHSECLTGEVFGSLKCDCKDQLDLALKKIGNEENGLVIYLRQEGRGIGIGNKIKAYDLQNKGLDTVDSNLELGFDVDLRNFETAAEILLEMGITSIHLNTNNPEKIKAMKDHGIQVISIIPSIGPINPHNQKYLSTKAERLGHLLN